MNNEFISLAKLAACIYSSYTYTYEKHEIAQMRSWYDDALPVIEKFGLKRKMNAVMRYLLKNEDPNTVTGMDTAIGNFFLELFAKRKNFDRELTIDKKIISLLNNIRLACLKGSDNSKKQVQQNIYLLGDTMVSSLFANHDVELGVDKDEMSDSYDKLESLVESVCGKRSHVMPAEYISQWAEEFRETGVRNPKHKQYLDLKKVIRETTRTIIRQIVRLSGNTLVPVDEIISKLNSEGVQHTLPEGFYGLMNEAGKFFTVEGKELNTTPSGEVKMNPEYKPKQDNAYVCEFYAPMAKNPTRAYTLDFRATSKTKKFSLVNEVIPKLSKLTKGWLADMAIKPQSRKFVLATLCEFIYDTSARVGNKNAATDGSKTYGATQLLCKHFKMEANKCTVTYIGKSGGRQKHIIQFNTVRSKRLQKALLHFLEGKKANDHVFTFRGLPTNGNAINKYLESIGFPKGFTIHKVRTARGTEMASKILKNCPFKKGAIKKDSDVHKWLEKELEKVGKELGHMSGENVTANTAIANYIAPELLADFYANLGIRPSGKVQKAIDAAKIA